MNSAVEIKKNDVIRSANLMFIFYSSVKENTVRSSIIICACTLNRNTPIHAKRLFHMRKHSTHAIICIIYECKMKVHSLAPTTQHTTDRYAYVLVHDRINTSK